MKKIFTLVLFAFVGLNITAQQCKPNDLSFGSNGKAISNFSTSNSLTIVQPDGKIIQAGNTSLSNGPVFFVLRLNFNGSPDLSFGNAGKIISSVSTYNDYLTDIALQKDGKIVIAGTRTYYLGNSSFVLFRYNENGTEDQTFGTKGEQTISFGSSFDNAKAIAIQTDGKILVSGETYSEANVCQLISFKYPTIAVARVNINGIIDSGFGQKGKIIYANENYKGINHDIDVQSNGKILVASSQGIDCKCSVDGYIGYEWMCNKFSFVVKRFNVDGSADSSFGLNGQARDTTNRGEIAKVIVQPDDKIVMAFDNNGADFLINRFDSEGELDIGFGQGGKIITELVNYSLPFTYLHDALIQPDGKILLLGHWEDYLGGSKSVIVKYKTNGDLDSSFYLNGLSSFNIDEGNSLAQSLALQGNTIIVGGNVSYSNSNNIIAIRFLEKSSVFEPDVVANGPLNFCGGDSVNLSTTARGFYQWYRDGYSLPNATNPAYKAIQSGSYRLIVNNSNGCGLSSPVNVEIRPRPQGVIIKWNGIQLSSDSIYTKYQWYLNGTPISGGNSYAYAPGSNLGVYKVQVTNSLNCSNFSNEFNYILTGVADLFLGDTKMRYYPNPAQSKLNIDIEKHTGKTIGGELYEMSGKLIFNQSLRQGHNEVSLSGLRPGVYSLVIRVGTETAVRKLIIVK